MKGLVAVIEQINQRVGGGRDGDEAGLRRQLLELRLRYEMDEIDEAEYEQAALEITRRLQALQVEESEGEDDAGST